MTKEDEAKFKRNIERVKGAEVTLRVWLDRASPKTAKVVGYSPPLVWELDKEIGGTKFHVDGSIATLDGKPLSEFPGLE